MGFYGDLSKYYERIFPVEEPTVRFLAEQAGPPPARILDVACGDAGYALALARMGYDVTATDLDADMVAKAAANEARIAIRDTASNTAGNTTSNTASNTTSDTTGDTSGNTASDTTSDTTGKGDYREACSTGQIRIFQADMLETRAALPSGETFSLVSCIGNSLVHLTDENQVLAFLTDAWKMLSTGSGSGNINNSDIDSGASGSNGSSGRTGNGTLVLQIMNYDKILKEDIRSLPSHVDNEMDLVFERRYRPIPGDNGHILFETTLKAEGHTWENAVRLIPLRHETLCMLLRDAGFADIRLYSDFEGAPYKADDSWMTVIAAR